MTLFDKHVLERLRCPFQPMKLSGTRSRAHRPKAHTPKCPKRPSEVESALAEKALSESRLRAIINAEPACVKLVSELLMKPFSTNLLRKVREALGAPGN